MFIKLMVLFVAMVRKFTKSYTQEILSSMYAQGTQD